ncbi:MAG: polyprenyl diphosphate synthase [Bacilli bacterium]|jgi:undecaprenyl diphosphate synthase
MEEQLPNHLAIIMDGNGRWAKKQGLNRSKGHLEGSKVLIDIVEYAFKRGIKVLSVFAFSTENFKRPLKEVNYLMSLTVKLLNDQLKRIIDNNTKVLFSGRKEGLSKEVLKAMKKVENESKKNDGNILNICFNYGGRGEIVDATKKIIAANIKIKDLDEDLFKKYLYNDLPDIDLVIRTSGELRLSNFLLFQLAYAELYFTEVYWPDFNYECLEKAIKEYNHRHRRFGNIN